jgi:tRNA (guanine-N7-)-methyltransferase
VQLEFVQFLMDYMAPGSDFFFATDFDDYGLDVAQLLPEVAVLENQFAPDQYRHEFPGYHLSKYMRKFMAEGKRIYFVHYKVKARAAVAEIAAEPCAAAPAAGAA